MLEGSNLHELPLWGKRNLHVRELLNVPLQMCWDISENLHTANTYVAFFLAALQIENICRSLELYLWRHFFLHIPDKKNQDLRELVKYTGTIYYPLMLYSQTHLVPNPISYYIDDGCFIFRLSQCLTQSATSLMMGALFLDSASA
jgi:hypothetical protein